MNFLLQKLLYEELLNMNNELEFRRILENKDLVSESTYNYINNTFSSEEKNNILVAEINPEYMDG